MSMNNVELVKFLTKHSACQEFIQWLGSRDLATAWAECPRAEWMFWLYVRSTKEDIKLMRLAVLDIADSVQDKFDVKYPLDERPRLAIAIARKYLLGTSTQKELLQARSAAYAAASDACANSYSAAYAASAAYASADAVTDPDWVNAYDAICAAAYATDPDWVNAYDAICADDDDVRRADLIRKYLPNPPFGL